MIIEMSKQMLFLKNIELTLFLESTINTSEIQNSFNESKFKIKNL